MGSSDAFLTTTKTFGEDDVSVSATDYNRDKKIIEKHSENSTHYSFIFLFTLNINIPNLMLSKSIDPLTTKTNHQPFGNQLSVVLISQRRQSAADIVELHTVHMC